MARNGAEVVLVGRNDDKIRAAMKAIRESVPDAKLDHVLIDLASLASVKAGAEIFLSRHGECHMLVLNAGVMMTPFTLSEDGYELQFASNHLGHFLLTQLLMDSLKKASPSRVVSVSSIASHFPWAASFLGFQLDLSRQAVSSEASGYDPMWAYGRSKLANVLFAQELSRRHAEDGVRANSLHPGVIGTNLYEGVFEKGAGYGITVLDMFGAKLTAWLRNAAFSLIHMTPEDGAVTQLYLATSPEIETSNIAGMYYVPQARPATSPSLATLENQQKLWKTSMELVAPFLRCRP